MNFKATTTVKFDSKEEMLNKVQNAALAGARKKAAMMQCKEHEQSATISFDDGRNFRISACCEPFADEVRTAIFKK